MKKNQIEIILDNLTQTLECIIIILGFCIELISVRLDTPGAPDYYPGFSMAAITAL